MSFKKIIIKFIFLLILSLFLFISVFNLKNDFYPVVTESSIIGQQVTAISIKKIENQQQFQKTETIGAVNQRKPQEELNTFHIVMGVIAGLVLFLYGVTKMAEGMEALAGDRVRNILRNFTRNPLAGVMTGTIATTILDSSSVTIIIVIAMVSAGLLTFVESLGVVLGSNIGTTFGAQVVAFNIDEYAPIALFIGFLLFLLGRNEPLKQSGLIVLGIGLLFFGLGYIEDATAPFRDYPQFINWMESLGHNTLQGALVGGLFTILIQSSSATLAIVVTLASQGLISLPTGIALMLGAEVGTCADTLVATIGRERPAIRTGVFHLIFNLASASIGLLFASQLAALSLWVSSLAGVGDNVARQIANAQLIFNLLGVLLVLGFLPWIARGLERLIPD
ncbi:Na/Pi cotransporter family protein [Nostocaceae cyanobacterium CENA357]|uniref:Na/Pi cotransporter family protein n=1 Tax=Atlanticothrix silvestris CENA357 TaxID=1725252 RepID=A0A8J7HPK3_9CYAN|nr:Na/Pi symporter [Atlanticothrix silvestris]MBH8556155.1 Na/Pi cotransporter family protein [Atlanticothrix silvestris CENA357]